LRTSEDRAGKRLSAESFIAGSATLWFVGRIPVAPGTFGTAAAVALVFLLKPGPVALSVIGLLFVFYGAFAAGRAEKTLGKDAPSIVIDEFAGYLVSVFFLPLEAGYILAAFILFRAFDILKPPPVRLLERLGGGAGVMADDVAAGVLTNLVLQGWRALLG
jgi:phosphatidylglycerophosphatase A